MKNSVCPLCNRASSWHKFAFPDYSIAYCKDCGLEFNPSFPPMDTEEKSFSKDYYLSIQKDAFAAQMNDLRLDPILTFYKHGLAQIEKFANGRTLLDVGAGLGAFMKAAYDAGWGVTGIEISPFGSDFIRQRYGFNICRQDLISFNCPVNSFHAVTFWDSIEHMKLPKENLRRAYDLLKPGGILLLTTDNYNSLLAGLAKIIFILSFKKISYPLKRVYTPYNRTYFNDSSMRKLLKEIGFQIVFFKKMQYPVDKIKVNFAENIIVRSLYFLEVIANRESQFTIIAKKI